MGKKILTVTVEIEADESFATKRYVDALANIVREHFHASSIPSICVHVEDGYDARPKARV